MSLLLLFNQTADPDAITKTGQTSGSTTGANTLTFAHEVTQADQYLTVVTYVYKNTDGGTVSGVTYNGDAMTLLKAAKHPVAPESQIGIWGLASPDVGNYNVVVTASQVEEIIAATAIDWENVGISDPTGTAVSHEPAGITDTTTVNVTSAANELVVAAATDFQYPLITGSGQVSLFNTATGHVNATYAASTKPGAASVTMSYTLASTQYPCMVAVPLKPIIDDVLYIVMI